MDIKKRVALFMLFFDKFLSTLKFDYVSLFNIRIYFKINLLKI